MYRKNKIVAQICSFTLSFHNFRQHPGSNCLCHRCQTAHLRQLVHPEPGNHGPDGGGPHSHLCPVPPHGALAIWPACLCHLHGDRLYRATGIIMEHRCHQPRQICQRRLSDRLQVIAIGFSHIFFYGNGGGVSIR